MNRGFLLQIDARLGRLEKIISDWKERMSQPDARIQALEERIAALEAKRGPGRPPKEQ